jgi:hypothetical protein
VVTLRHSDLQPTVLQKEQLKADLQGSFAHCNPASHELEEKPFTPSLLKGLLQMGRGGGGME